MNLNITPDFLAPIAGAGIVAFIFFLAFLVVGFVISAWIMNLYTRLVLRFMRKSLDREYRYMRGDYSNAGRAVQRASGPRDWSARSRFLAASIR